MYKVFDIENWKRKDLFHFFRTYDDPFTGVTTTLDVTKLHTYCKQGDHSFFLASLYFLTQAMNQVEEFKLRILDGQVVLYDRIDCGSTILHDDETFSFCYFEMKDHFVDFERSGKVSIENQLQKKKLEPREDELGVIHCTVIPWTSFTSIKHARRMDNEDSIPKVALGKYYTEGSIIVMPISIEVNHALLDGVHVGKFLNLLQETLHSLS
jgi:chloramphenicol O-acetyltransferase type A